MNKELFGLNLRKIRLEKGVTLRALAAKMGIAPAYLCDIEKGNRAPTIKICANVCNCLNLTNQEKRILFDAAALYSDTLPYDVIAYLLENKQLLENIKKQMMENNYSYKLNL